MTRLNAKTAARMNGFAAPVRCHVVTVFAAMYWGVRPGWVTATTLAPPRFDQCAALLSMVAHQSSALFERIARLCGIFAVISPIVIFLACCVHSFDKTISKCQRSACHPFVPVTVVWQPVARSCDHLRRAAFLPCRQGKTYQIPCQLPARAVIGECHYVACFRVPCAALVSLAQALKVELRTLRTGQAPARPRPYFGVAYASSGCPQGACCGSV